MEGWKTWKTGLLTAVGGIALWISNAGQVCADFAYSAPVPEETAQIHARSSGEIEYVPRKLPLAAVVSDAHEDAEAVLRGLQKAWQALKHEAALAAVTMFFIRAGTPPPSLPGPPKTTTTTPPPPSDPPPSGGTPPPPSGSGEPGPGDPGVPPVGTPEPASAALALLGAAIAAGWQWRRVARKASVIAQ